MAFKITNDDLGQILAYDIFAKYLYDANKFELAYIQNK